MSWFAIVLLALTAFALAAWALKLPRQGWTLMGAALMFGLAGYAVQGSPSQPASPRAQVADVEQNGEFLVSLRRAFFDPETLPSRFVVTSDAFARRGQYENAARFLDNAVRADPNDAEAWVALGNALVEHAGGQLGPASLLAYQKANAADENNPAARYFTGLAWLRSDEPGRTLVLWQSVLDDAPDDAAWLPLVREQVARLEQLRNTRAPAVGQ